MRTARKAHGEASGFLLERSTVSDLAVSSLMEKRVL